MATNLNAPIALVRDAKQQPLPLGQSSWDMILMVIVITAASSWHAVTQFDASIIVSKWPQLGGHKLSCEICTQSRHAAEAEARDWQLIGPAPHRSSNYREYEHICSHRQSVTVANMRNGDVDCAGCGESWSSKPSTIYLFHFAFSGIELIKLGFSSNPQFRMRQVQTAPKRTRATLVRTLPLPSGHDAVCIEKALHSHIKSNRPEFIVSPEIFRNHINTTSEIYHVQGRAYIERLMSAVEAGWNPRCGDITDFIDGKS